MQSVKCKMQNVTTRGLESRCFNIASENNIYLMKPYKVKAVSIHRLMMKRFNLLEHHLRLCIARLFFQEVSENLFCLFKILPVNVQARHIEQRLFVIRIQCKGRLIKLFSFFGIIFYREIIVT